MKYLFDTDHISVFQRGRGIEYDCLADWMITYSPSDFAWSVISLQEQFLGAHHYLTTAKNSAGLVRGYQYLECLPRDYTNFSLLPFDSSSAAVFDKLTKQNLRVGAMDLRLAAIALSRDLTLLTRNRRDFARIPGVRFEDRTQ